MAVTLNDLPPIFTVDGTVRLVIVVLFVAAVSVTVPFPVVSALVMVYFSFPAV